MTKGKAEAKESETSHEPGQRRVGRGALFFGGGALGIALLLAVLFLAITPALTIPPGKPIDTDEYDLAFDETKVRGKALSEAELRSLPVTWSEKRDSVEIREGPFERRMNAQGEHDRWLYEYLDNGRFQWLRADSAGFCRGDFGVVGVDHLGISFGAEAGVESEAVEGLNALTFYDAEQDPLGTKEMASRYENRWDSHRFGRRWKSGVSFRLAARVAAQEPVDFLQMQAFDRHSRYPIMNRTRFHGVSSAQTRFVELDTTLFLYHDAPVAFVVDVVGGREEVVEVDPEVPTTVSLGELSVRYLGPVLGHVEVRSSLTGAEGVMHRSTVFQSRSPLSDDLAFSLVFLHEELGVPVQIEIEAFNHQGQVIPQLSRHEHRNLFATSYEGKKEDLAALRLKAKPDYYRLVYKWDHLPGLPDRNRNVADLLDLTVPKAVFRNRMEIRNFLSETLQIDIVGVFPDMGFAGPQTYQNVTLRELWSELLRAVPQPCSAEFDQERRVVSVKDQSLLNRARRWGKALSNRW